MGKTLSLVVSAYNEEKKIGACIKSASGITDEVIIIDNTSSDQTAKIAKSLHAKVFTRENNLMLNVNKNFGFEKATSDWILNLDADEELTVELRSEIQKILESSESLEVNGYWIPRKNIIFGKWIQHGFWWPDKQLRLFRKGFGKFPCKHVSEYISVEGKLGDIQEPYVHNNYETVSQYLRKLDLYTTNECDALLSSNYQSAWYDAIRFPLSDFLKVYFAQEGYKDGLHGLVLSLLQAFYSLVVFAKLWEKQQFPQKPIAFNSVVSEFTRAKKEFRYWIMTSQIKAATGIKKFAFKLMRKLFV